VIQALSCVRQAARHRKKERFTALLHHLNVDTLRTAFLALKRKAALGVDGVTWWDYEAELEPNLEDLARKVQLTELADEQDRLIAELQEDVGCRSRLSNSRRSSPRRSWRRNERVREEGRYSLSFPARWLIPRPDLLPDQIRSHSRFAMMPTLASIVAAASRQTSSR
jgi:hypothetical protein